jgi:PAS domain S-box-containing protein
VIREIRFLSFLERNRQRVPRLRAGSPVAYALAALIVIGAVLLPVTLDPWFPGILYATLFPAIMIATFIGGVGPGLVAIALGTVALWFVIYPLVATVQIADLSRIRISGAFVVTGFLGVVVVGLLKASIGRIRELNAFKLALFESNPDAILVIDGEGRIIRANERAVGLFGYACDALINQPVEILLPDRLKSGHFSHRTAFFANPQRRKMGAGLALLGRRADGCEFPVEVQLGPIKLSSEVDVMAIVRDITEQKAAAELLMESGRQQAMLEERERGAEEVRRWAAAFENAAVGIAIADANSNTIKSANPAFAAAHGMSVAELEGMQISDIYTPQERIRVGALLSSVDQGGHVSYETMHVRKNGIAFPARTDIASVRDAAGNVIYRIASVMDISERRLTERKLVQAQKMEAIGNLTGGMAHDFNNLLGVIIGNLQLLSETIHDSPEQEEFCADALGAARRGADLTRRLLAFGRRQPLRPESTDINRLITEVTRFLGRMLGEDIAVSLNLSPDLAPTVIDPVQLESTIANLAGNARDAMPRGGRLIIATSLARLDDEYVTQHPEAVPGDYVVVEVTDTGAGMSSDTMTQIFEPFFTTKPPGEGTGLGLSMVFGFMKQSGGHINVYSELGHGTTVRLYVPYRLNGEMPVENVPSRVVIGGNESILLVEDDPQMRRTVTKQLTELGYVVSDVASAATALTVLSTARFDLLLADVVMAGEMDGIELVDKVALLCPSMKALLMSGFPGARLEKSPGTGLRTRLLSKPFEQDDLALAIREALATAQESIQNRGGC